MIWRRKGHAEPRPIPLVLQPEPRAAVRVTDQAVAKSRQPRAKPVNPFKVDPSKLHPKAAVPAMAMDEAPGQFSAWAAGAVSGLISEGQAFLGYPVLAEMAQRPEYRKISETLARHMTRKWIRFTASGDEDKSEKIAELEAAIDKLRLKAAVKRALAQDGFFGRGHIYIDTGHTDDPEELKLPIGDGLTELSQGKIAKGSIKRFRTVEAVWAYPTNYNSNDPLKEDWYRPASWFVMGKEVHASRFLTFIGREVPDLLKPAYSFGDLSLTQMAKPYVDNWLRTRQSVSDIVAAFTVFLLKTTLAEQLNSGDGGEQMFKRAELFNNLRDNRGLMIVDKDNEDFTNVSASLAGLDVLQAQSMEQICSISGLPVIEYAGNQPAGLNASSEGEIRVFEQGIHSMQEDQVRPNLTILIDLVQLSTFGEVDPDIVWEFVPLRSLDEKEQSDKRRQDAETDSIYFEMGAVGAPEIRQKLANDPDSAYPGLDPDDMPKMPGEGEIGEPPKPSPPSASPQAHDAEWEESKHPRAENGQFGSGGGGASSSGPTDAQKAALKHYTEPPR